ncbi:AraC family transcriptional regulator [Streptomyces liangshanensis]|uniref:AraC family transcriptional regulator n=1 Tax=Streptomyces liangshanensis TaxID=2717324 RepID=A0A6G9GU74_9ACTN|nr:AraC family transcriptional regulator [Streptomyces liangshanensis]QIQ01571.1 AraC family transcriptional regulator [Streptomyces liangshanensis]
MSSVPAERAAYWRVDGLGLEAMGARFHHFAYPTHSHDTYAFGVTDQGAQSFLCRGERATSAQGHVMAFNPDDPHDGYAAADGGYRYRMLHIPEHLVRDVLADTAGARAGLPLFSRPVVNDPALARTLVRLHRAIVDREPRLVVDERLTAAVIGMTGHATAGPARRAQEHGRAGTAATRARALLEERFTENVGADELAAAAGCSRYALYRGFHAAYGLAPSDYQRDLRLRRARSLLAAGLAPSAAAASAGFADQAHLSRWFTRTYGIPPGAYHRADGTPRPPP